MNPKKIIVEKSEAASLLSSLSEEFAVVRNPESVFPPFELYPLPPKQRLLHRGMIAAVMDMDGTTTTTEALCLHSLETMVRRLIGADDDSKWPGLDRAKDFPHIIGNSTTKHVEYLIRTYGQRLDSESFRLRLFFALAWNFANRPERRAEIRSTGAALGIGNLLEGGLAAKVGTGSAGPEAVREAIDQVPNYDNVPLRLEDETQVVRAAIEIYYQEYHSILMGIAKGEGQAIATRLFGNSDRRLIEPMKGVGYFLAMIRGLLGADAEFGFEEIAAQLSSLGFSQVEIERNRPVLRKLGRYFAANPVAVGLVTSSIEYEANVVLTEVFRILKEEARDWNVDERVRDAAEELFSDYRNAYGAVVTASDSCEIRLKPHRDLYSLALSRLGIGPAELDRVIGFEDSESGTVAIRAAGIPLGVALPFPETEGHSFDAASQIATGGLPEVVLLKHCFLSQDLLS
jgi:beta-phosphoglucomutase-like phosphatase (HAD superfamily)